MKSITKFNSSLKLFIPTKFYLSEFLNFLNLKEEDFSRLIFMSEQINKQKNFEVEYSRAYDLLTKREKEIFLLMLKGKTSKEISEILFIEIATISTHRKKIKRKLNLKSCLDMYKYAKVLDLDIFD